MLNFQDHRISISPIQLLAPALLLASVSLASPPTATVPPFVFGDTDLSLGTTAYRPLFYDNTGLGNNGGSAGPFAMPIPLQSVTPGPKLMPGRKAWIDMVPK